MKRENLLVVIVLLFMAFSCEKDAEIIIKTDLISGSLWKVSSKTIEPPMMLSGIPVSDIVPFDTDSVRNYLYKFFADGNFTIYNEFNIPLFETSWSFNEDETLLSLNEPLVFVYPIFGGIPLSVITIDTITSTYIRASVPYEYEANKYEMLIVFKDSGME